MQEQHTIELAPGLRIPAIGLGTWPLTGEEAADAVARALGNGYRHVDTAANYGNEQAVGEGIARAGVRREELWVTSKFNKEDHSRDGVAAAYERACDLMGLDYLDLAIWCTGPTRSRVPLLRLATGWRNWCRQASCAPGACPTSSRRTCRQSTMRDCARR